MKELYNNFKKGIAIGVGFFCVLGVVYSWDGLTASSGDTLTSAKWNELLNQVEISNSIQNLPRLNTPNGEGTTAATNTAPSISCARVEPLHIMDCTLGQDLQGRDYKIVSGGGYCTGAHVTREFAVLSGGTVFRLTCKSLDTNTDSISGVGGVDLVVQRIN